MRSSTLLTVGTCHDAIERSSGSTAGSIEGDGGSVVVVVVSGTVVSVKVDSVTSGTVVVVGAGGGGSVLAVLPTADRTSQALVIIASPIRMAIVVLVFDMMSSSFVA
jgi:hypothetical protein